MSAMSDIAIRLQRIEAMLQEGELPVDTLTHELAWTSALLQKILSAQPKQGDHEHGEQQFD